jgi:hypothetical protein
VAASQAREKGIRSDNSQQMESMKSPCPFSQVYLIFRVYRLCADDIEMRIYVDPAKQRDEGELKFTWNGAGYTITPDLSYS